MKENIPPDLEQNINDWYEGNIKKRLQDSVLEVQLLGASVVPTEEQVKETVNKANSIIKEASNGDEELYDYYKYRVFYQDQHYIIVWGDEVNLDE